jgi:hypothetical protein
MIIGKDNSFKHALVQDAAYAMILKQKRQRLHGRCAIALEAHFPSICEREPGVPALHPELADNAQATVPFFLAAGQLAVERSALIEASRYLQRGLSLLETLPESDSRNREELRFRSILGWVCIFSKGWTHPSVKSEYGRPLRRVVLVAALVDAIERTFGPRICRYWRAFVRAGAAPLPSRLPRTARCS